MYLIEIVRLQNGPPNGQYLKLTINEEASPPVTRDGWWRIRHFLDIAVSLAEHPPTASPRVPPH